MADPETLARVYAQALLELAFDKGVHGEVLAELREFRALIASEPTLEAFLGVPSISPDVKKDMIGRVFGGKLSDVTLNFLKVLLDKGRVTAFGKIVSAFEDGYHLRQGELVVQVTSAVALDDEQRERLARVLKGKFNKDVLLEEGVDEGLLGGLVLSIGDQRIDGSLRSHLETVGARLRGSRLRSEVYYED